MLSYNLETTKRMVCENNPCPQYLPKVGDPSPIVGDEGNTSNMNLIATGYSGGARRISRRLRRNKHRKSHRQQRKSRRGGTLEGGRRKRRTRHSRKSKRN